MGHGKCGGNDYWGPTQFVPDTVCKYESEYFSKCVDDGKSKGRGPFENCGGKGYTGEPSCKYGWQCMYKDEYYSQWLPAS
jgi:hypothetical protein